MTGTPTSLPPPLRMRVGNASTASLPPVKTIEKTSTQSTERSSGRDYLTARGSPTVQHSVKTSQSTGGPQGSPLYLGIPSASADSSPGTPDTPGSTRRKPVPDFTAPEVDLYQRVLQVDPPIAQDLTQRDRERGFIGTKTPPAASSSSSHSSPIKIEPGVANPRIHYLRAARNLSSSSLSNIVAGDDHNGQQVEGLGIKNREGITLGAAADGEEKSARAVEQDTVDVVLNSSRSSPVSDRSSAMEKLPRGYEAPPPRNSSMREYLAWQQRINQSLPSLPPPSVVNVPSANHNGGGPHLTPAQRMKAMLKKPDDFEVKAIPTQLALFEASKMLVTDQNGNKRPFGSFFCTEAQQSETQIRHHRNSTSSTSSPASIRSRAGSPSVQSMSSQRSASTIRPSRVQKKEIPKVDGEELLVPGRKTVAFFIRSHWCGQCQDFSITSLASLDAQAIHAAGYNVVVISNGPHKVIGPYRRLTKLPFPMFMDNSTGCKLYAAMGMTKYTNDFGPWNLKNRASYHRNHVPKQVAVGLTNAFTKMPLALPGKLLQLGGEFILGPGLTCHWAHRMTNTSNHVEAPKVLEIAGCSGCTLGQREQVERTQAELEEIARLQQEEDAWNAERENELERMRMEKLRRRGMGSPGLVMPGVPESEIASSHRMSTVTEAAKEESTWNGSDSQGGGDFYYGSTTEDEDGEEEEGAVSIAHTTTSVRQKRASPQIIQHEQALGLGQEWQDNEARSLEHEQAIHELTVDSKQNNVPNYVNVDLESHRLSKLSLGAVLESAGKV